MQARLTLKNGEYIDAEFENDLIIKLIKNDELSMQNMPWYNDRFKMQMPIYACKFQSPFSV